MADRSRIEWTDATWNVSRGCTKVSAGCTNCYAENFSNRWKGIEGHPYSEGFAFREAPDQLLKPLYWEKSRRIFVNSMSDLFHERMDVGYLSSVFEIMKISQWHYFQLLTKRADLMNIFLTKEKINLPNLWLGVSCENRKSGLDRVKALQQSQPGLKFVSFEPLLEDLGTVDLKGIDWAIIGGETGTHARELKESWLLKLIDQCNAQGVKIFFKQWGNKNRSRNDYKIKGRTLRALPKLKSLHHRCPERAYRLAIIQSMQEKIKKESSNGFRGIQLSSLLSP